MILDKIVQVKRQEVAAAKQKLPLAELIKLTKNVAPCRNFKAALAAGSAVSLIAEVKKASPSKGLIRPNFDPVQLAEDYREGGAQALSVLTDEQFFQGSLTYLKLIRERVNLPLLRKDFVIDPYQIYQARVAGADAVLLIARILSAAELDEYLGIVRELGMDALVETHTTTDLAKSVAAGAEIIGINNRDLATFTTNLTKTTELAPHVPANCLLVSESGINRQEDVELLRTAGVKAVLVGEALAKEDDVVSATRKLLGLAENRHSHSNFNRA